MATTKIITTTAYDPMKVLLYMGGIKVSGYAADTKIVIARNNDNIIPHVGVDGEMSAALSRDASGVLTVSLQNTSPWNSYLASWQKQSSVTGQVFFPVQVEGSQGLSLSTFGWIQKQPDLTYGTEVGQMDWEIGILDAWLAPDTTTSIISNVLSLTGLA